MSKSNPSIRLSFTEPFARCCRPSRMCLMGLRQWTEISHEIDVTATLIFMATGAAAQAQLTPRPRRAPSRSRSQPFRSDPLCKPPRYRGRQWRRPSVWRSNGTSPGWPIQWHHLRRTSASRMVEAIRVSEGPGAANRPVLNPRERQVLAETAKRRQGQMPAGRSSPMPARGPGLAFHQAGASANLRRNGAKWSSTTGTIQIQLSRRKEATQPPRSYAEREKKEPIGRNVDYTVVNRISSCCRDCKA